MLQEYLLFSGVALFAGYILDLLFGDPYLSFHPICLIGNLISKLEKKLYRPGDGKKLRAGGRCLVAGVLGIVLLIVEVLRIGTFLLSPYVFLVIESVLIWFALAQTSLRKESMKVYEAFQKGDTEGARYAVSMIVGRDTKVLDADGITRAAVETVAENTSDGIIAPLFFTGLFGGFGAYLYKSINTMDSMVGYKNEKYMDFGRCAAKLDDVVNYIPARLSALYMIVAARILRMNYNNAAKIFKRDRYNHASPNSAQTESVCAGALDLRLAGDAWYGGVLFKKKYIGDDIRPIEPEDIKRACDLMNVTCHLFLVTIVVLKGLLIWGLYAG